MARPQRFLSTKRAPIDPAVTIPASLARQDTSMSRAIGELGSGLLSEGIKRSDAEKKAQAELQRRTQANIDFLQANKARSELKVKGVEFEAFKKTHDAIEWVEQAQEVDFTIDTTNMSPQNAQRAQQEALIAQQEFLAKTTLEATAAIGEAATTQASVLYQEALEDPTLTEEDRKIAQAQWLAIAQNTMEDNEAIALGDKMAEDAVEDRQAAGLEELQEVAAISPERAIETVDAELARRRETGDEPEGDELTNQQLVNTKNYAKSVINTNKIKKENTEKVIENELSDGIWEGQVDSGQITASETSAAAKRRLRGDLKEYQETLKKTVNDTWAEIDNRETFDELNSMLTAVDTGQMTVADFRTELGLRHNQLSKTTYQSMQNTARNGGRTAVEKAVNSYDKDIYNIVVGPTLSQLEAVLESQETIVAAGKKLTEQQKLRLASVRGQKQSSTLQYNLLVRAIETEVKEAGVETLTSRDIDKIVAKHRQVFSLKTKQQKTFEYFNTISRGMTDAQKREEWLRLNNLDENAVVEAPTLP